MTDKQLQSLGIYKDNSKLKPYQYYCNVTSSYINVYKTDTPEKILEFIYNEGIENDIKLGKEQRSNEIKKLLNNTDIL